MDNGPQGRIGLSEALIINIPAFLFLGFTPVSLFCLRLEGLRWLALFPLVWGVSGFVLLFFDYFHRKKELYLRLIPLHAGRSFTADAYLKGTFCGFCMNRALGLRYKSKGGCE